MPGPTHASACAAVSVSETVAPVGHVVSTQRRATSRSTNLRRRTGWLPKFATVALLLLGGCELPGGGVGSASRVSEVATECDDPQGRAAWQEAQQQLDAGNELAAVAALQRVAERCPDFVRGNIRYQDTARRLGGDHERRMVEHYRSAVTSASAERQYLRARLAETAYAQANELNEILKRHPRFGWAHLSRGRINRTQGRQSEALQDFERALATDPSLTEALLERSQVLVEIGRDEEAAVGFDRYLRQRPDDLTATRQYLTLLLYRLGRTEQAMKLIEKLESLGDRSIALRMDRAAALWRARRFQAAAEAYLAILREQPSIARAALNLGLLYYEVVPQTDAQRQRCWPKARAAFRWFLQQTEPSDGHEQFERTWAVPFRLQRIARSIGSDQGGEPQLDDLTWPDGVEP